ncbi:hypothetical protein dsx2_2001 [Desulfovibrio sp. X2]|uniref:hypothetical protein n=1 Tax=Desulfovibrio sp. X2 TaxID=941449 RepID=UPI0003589963|nr:hypothetical protein [Desulfovibrio sp. X2]EPR43962.1 hypothetical protein dsx2_2001 [Desulfovibrio sp. X2]
MSIDTKTFANALRDTMPQCLASMDDAEKVMTVMSTVITNALKNQDTVYFEGIGEWRSELADGRKKVIFTPDRILMDAVNE